MKRLIWYNHTPKASFPWKYRKQRPSVSSLLPSPCPRLESSSPLSMWGRHGEREYPPSSRLVALEGMEYLCPSWGRSWCFCMPLRSVWSTFSSELIRIVSQYTRYRVGICKEKNRTATVEEKNLHSSASLGKSSTNHETSEHLLHQNDDLWQCSFSLLFQTEKGSWILNEDLRLSHAVLVLRDAQTVDNSLSSSFFISFPVRPCVLADHLVSSVFVDCCKNIWRVFFILSKP